MTWGWRRSAYPAYSSMIVFGVHGQRVVDPGQDLVLLHERCLDLLPEDLGIEQVLDPDPEPGVFVGVGGADALLGRADLVLAQIALDGGVELAVVGHDQMCVRGHPHP